MRKTLLETLLLLALVTALPWVAGAVDGETRVPGPELPAEALTPTGSLVGAVAAAETHLAATQLAMLTAEEALLLDPANPDLQADRDAAMAAMLDAEAALAAARTELGAERDTPGRQAATTE